MIWFTSDTHYFHKNVITYCNRPFQSVEEMNATLIKNYNDRVSDRDDVWFLGDIIFGGVGKAKSIISQLKGHKHLIMGNHDRNNKAHRWLEFGFDSIYPSLKLEGFNLSHFPYRGHEHDERYFESQLDDDGNWLLHGHVHCNWKTKDKMINVGVDVWDYAPVDLDTIRKLTNPTAHVG